MTIAAELKPAAVLAVERGVKWLDEVRPEWRDLIDLESLQISSTSNCVAGQVFRDKVGTTIESALPKCCDACDENRDRSIHSGFDYVYYTLAEGTAQYGFSAGYVSDYDDVLPVDEQGFRDNCADYKDLLEAWKVAIAQ